MGPSRRRRLPSRRVEAIAGLRDSHVVPPDDVPPWGVVVPVKRLATAKTRLGAYGDALRQELALAFATDVVAAVLRCDMVVQVLVVTDDGHAGDVLRELGALVEADAPDAGLNPALAHGADLLRGLLRTQGLPGTGVATVSADLPSLRPDDLAAALAGVPVDGRAFVPDADRHGTTLLAAAPGADLSPGYGGSSRLRHLRSGAVELAGTPALRRDVDTPSDLAEAVALGVGPRTAALVARLPALRS